jgi:hypothetical protein
MSAHSSNPTASSTPVGGRPPVGGGPMGGRGPMAGGPMAMMRKGEKPRDFKGP